MSLIAVGAGSTEPVTIVNAPFFPDLTVSDFRDSMRIDGTVTEHRATNALLAAMFDVNGQLANWVETQQAAGHQSLIDVTPPPWYPADAYKTLYLRAVWSLGKANLVERYRDFDSTNSGHGRADEMVSVVDDLRRDAAWAIADILGRRRTTVELI